ncbi:hypothetical protein ABPG73_008220 [Tetrahymena malaccensis]
MLQIKTFALLSIFLILAKGQNLTQNVEQSTNGNQKLLNDQVEKKNSQFSKSYQLLSASIVDEAVQELCPFPGYHGTYCPQQIPAFLAQKRQLQQSIPRMPSGIGASFDISTGELKLPAVQLTYPSDPSQQYIYKDPHSDHQFLLPQEIQTEQVNLDADIKIFKNEFELTNIWLDATKNGQWLGGEYSQLKDLNYVFDRFFRGNQETSISQLSKNVVRLTFKTSDLKLNRFAQRAIDSLPEEFQPDIYNEFMNSWGTHISVDTFIGGMIEKQTVFKDCVYYTPSFTGGLSADQLYQALHNELHGQPGDGYFVGRRQVSLDHRFGGNPEDVANWESTISQNPALLRINRFISWDNMTANPQVKANLQQAINYRVESMRQRQESYQAQVREERRVQNCAPRAAYAITGYGRVPGFTTSQFINIRSYFTMKEASQCPVGLPLEVSKSSCSSGNMDSLDGMMYEVRYERDDQGNFRAAYQNFQDDSTQLPNFYGNWVDRGCSIAQDYRDPQFTDLNQIPPDGSNFKILCTDCVPSVYIAPEGQQLVCTCPAF